MAAKNPSPWYYASPTGGLTDATSHQLTPAVPTQRNFCSGFQMANKSATASEIVILDGATVIWRGYSPASASKSDSFNFDPPLVSSPGNALNVQMVTTATQTIVSAQGFVDV